MARILQPTDENLRTIRKFLHLGTLVAIPTETVYGLAANALSEDACKRIFETKGRPSSDPLICHVPNFDSIGRFAYANELAESLANRFWPGPLTLVLKKKPIVPDIVTSGLDSVAIRISAHPVMAKLLQGLDFPLAAPSANPFAYISPTTPQHVDANLGDRIDCILDGGPCIHGMESTIVDARDAGSPRVLRYGALPKETIESHLGYAIESPSLDSKQIETSLAPGSLPKHYSPNTTLEVRKSRITDGELEKADSSPKTAYLVIAKPDFETEPNVFHLSESGALAEAASRLYDRLRQIDRFDFERIVAEEATPSGLGLAINDRLSRAAFEA